MAKEQETQVITGINYIEPNLIHSIEGDDGTFYETTPNMEDYCVVVNLGVTIQGKRYAVGDMEGGNRVIMSFNVSEGTVNFMQGTKIYYDTQAQSGDYINSLTTDYADMSPKEYLTSKGKTTTTELFGIESIDINYDNYYVPQVTVRFVDVRGMSLFMPEEYRHGKSVNGIDGFADGDIAGSFFKSFFTFPYPKFDLMVKGIYGKPVTFELSVVDWKATFDCDRGSFGCTVNFIGYSYALLSDLTLNAIIASTESDYVGKEYFRSNSKYTYHEGSKIKSFNEFWQAYQESQVHLEKVAANSDLAKRVESITIESNQLTALNTAIGDFIAEMRKMVESNDASHSPYYYVANGTSDCYICFRDIEDDIPTKIKNKYDAIQDVILKNTSFNFGDEAFIDWVQREPDKQQNQQQYKTIANTITKKANFSFLQGLKDNDGNKAEVYKYYVAVYFYDLQKQIQSKLDANNKEIESLNAEIAKQNNEIVKQYIGFNPDIENLIRMFCAHIDTFIHCVTTAANSAGSDSKRSLSNPGESSDFTGNTVPAFPKVITEMDVTDPDKLTSSDSGSTQFRKYEDAWIGDVMESAPEADLIEGLLNGIKLINETFQETEEVLQSTDNSNRNSKLKIPIVPSDFLSDDSVFYKSGENLQENNETYARIALRAFTVLSTAPINVNKDIDIIGKADAINFYNMVGNNISTNFKEKVKSNAILNDINNNTILNSAKYGELNIFISDNTAKVTINKQLGKFVLNPDDNSYFIPLSNVSFSLLKPAYQYENEDLIYYNAYSEKHKRYCFAILNQEESNIMVQKYSNAPSLGTAEDTDTYKALYPEMTLDDSEINSTYYNGNEEAIINSLCRNTQEGTSSFWDDVLSIFKSKDNKTDDIRGNIFGNYLYYYNSDNVTERVNDTEKAVLFLQSLVSIDETKNFIDWLKNPQKGIKTIPKIILLYCGCLIELAGGDYKKAKYFSEHFEKSNQILRKEVVDTIREYYKNWESSTDIEGFQYFKEKLELPKYFIDGLRDGFIKKEDIPGKFGMIENNIYQLMNDGKNCEAGKSFKIEMELLGTENQSANFIRANLRNIMDGKITIVKSTNNTVHTEKTSRTSPNPPSTNIGNMNSYFMSFFKKLAELYKGDDDKEQRNSNVKDPNIIKDVKISLYKYIKLMFDRWFCGRLQEAKEDWGYEQLLDRFVIIDSFYFKVGKNILFDIRKLFNRMKYSLEQETYSVASFINDVLSDNDMLFLSIQNFADLSEPDFLKTMFTPIPYRKIGKVVPTTNFICLYTYKSSNHLNLPDSDFADDSFMLNDKENVSKAIPYVVANRQPQNSYDIPSFGVTYGKQYQSYFLKVDPSMESPIMTEQSLKAQYLLQQEASDSAKKIKFYGQDLYTVYSNNSYTCTVEMLGCAWVQPLMYFVLLNIPMFRGSYLIQQVSHHIEQGKMITRFVGTRMSRTCTPFVKEAIGVQNNDANGSDTNNRLGSDDINTGDENLNACAYETYPPESAASDLTNNSNVIKEPSFYDDNTLSELGIHDLRGRGNWTLRQGITFIAQKEAENEGALGKQLVTTVCLNRYVNEGWNKVFDGVQFSSWKLSGGAPGNDTDVDKVLTNGPHILIGKTAEPAEAIDVYSQQQLIGKAESVELTKDNLSKIYMFNNLSAYSRVSINSTANPIKKTKYAFTHNHHVFHYGPQPNSDTSFWKDGNSTKLSELEELLSENKMAFGIYSAIKLSARNSRIIESEIQLAEIDANNSNTFSIVSDDNGKMHLIYDMILDSYSQYISELGWIMKTQSDYAAPTPSKIRITVGNGKESRAVYMGNVSNGSIQRNDNAITLNGLSGVTVNFLGSVSKHYNTVASFQKDCKNFNNEEIEEIYNYLHNENNYGFSCNGGTVSKYYGNSDADNIDGDTLPKKIYFPVQKVGANGGVLDNPILGECNYSGYFTEPRNVYDKNGNKTGQTRLHKAIDIGTAKDAGFSMIAIWDGVVVHQESNGYGSPCFVIQHANCTNGGRVLYTRYLHGIGNNIYVGKTVHRGEVLGKVSGVTGYPIHLHIEFAFLNGSTTNFNINEFKQARVDPAKYYYFGKYKGGKLSQWIDKLGMRVDLI